MKTWTKFVAALAIVGLVGVAKAADPKPAADKPAAAAGEGKKAKKAPAVRGKFVKVDGSSVVISSGKKGEEKDVTITTDASTVIKVDGKDGKLEDIKAGMMIAASPETGPAKTLSANTPKPKGEKKADKAAAK